jgi:hypothetical protein
MEEKRPNPNGPTGAAFVGADPKKVTGPTGPTEAAGVALSGSVIVSGGQNISIGSDIAGRNTVINLRTSEIGDKKTISAEQAFDRIAAAVKVNLTQITENIEQARRESSQFFKLTLVFASLGFIIVAAGVILLYFGQIAAGTVAAISGAIPELTAALFFRKDQELRRTIELYHNHMLSSQRLLTMIDVAETMQNAEEQDKIKQQIILATLGPSASP